MEPQVRIEDLRNLLRTTGLTGHCPVSLPGQICRQKSSLNKVQLAKRINDLRLLETEIGIFSKY
jgi:hypothetical protein